MWKCKFWKSIMGFSIMCAFTERAKEKIACQKFICRINLGGDNREKEISLPTNFQHHNHQSGSLIYLTKIQFVVISFKSIHHVGDLPAMLLPNTLLLS